MKLRLLLHQQIFQIRWQFFACLGLIMALPLEEAMVNLIDGDGFHTIGFVLLSVMIAPFLAGLVACASVQADLDNRRDCFWRSRPVRVQTFMMFKYSVGIVLTLILMACPVLFSMVSTHFCKPLSEDIWTMPLVYNMVFVSAMAYSLCFLCNVLIRKTARAWLVGMTVTALLLLMPFVLPLNFRDLRADFLTVISPVYVFLTLGTAVAAMALMLLAASCNWHLRTNLKGLLWIGGAGLFLLMLLSSRQVANIKVLDETRQSGGAVAFSRVADQYEFGNQAVRVENNQLLLAQGDAAAVKASEFLRSERLPFYRDKTQKKRLETYPHESFVYHEINGQLYAFAMYHYYELEDREYDNGRTYQTAVSLKCSLRGYLFSNGQYELVAEQDLSDCLHQDGTGYITCRIVGDTIIAIVEDQCVSVSIGHSGQLTVLGQEKIKRYRFFEDWAEDLEFKIPLLPLKGVDPVERIRATIDFSLWGGYRYNDSFARRSCVDIDAGQIFFYNVFEFEIVRYDVLRWDDEYIYCRFHDVRPFSYLERMSHWNHDDRIFFVQDGKLYIYSSTKLMVFDIRCRQMRKLGHWERWGEGCRIEQLEVLKDGNLLLKSLGDKVIVEERPGGVIYDCNSNLYLLKNPQ